MLQLYKCKVCPTTSRARLKSADFVLEKEQAKDYLKKFWILFSVSVNTRSQAEKEHNAENVKD